MMDTTEAVAWYSGARHNKAALGKTSGNTGMVKTEAGATTYKSWTQH
jgi:hypothetical protein